MTESLVYRRRGITSARRRDPNRRRGGVQSHRTLPTSLPALLQRCERFERRPLRCGSHDAVLGCHVGRRRQQLPRRGHLRSVGFAAGCGLRRPQCLDTRRVRTLVSQSLVPRFLPESLDLICGVGKIILQSGTTARRSPRNRSLPGGRRGQWCCAACGWSARGCRRRIHSRKWRRSRCAAAEKALKPLGYFTRTRVVEATIVARLTPRPPERRINSDRGPR